MIYDLQPKYEFWLMICCVLQIYSYFWQCRQCPPFNSLGTGGLGRGSRDLTKNTEFAQNLGNPANIPQISVCPLKSI